MGYLYKLDFSSGKSYIGITTQKRMSDRIKGHKHDAEHGRKNNAVQLAWRKHGEPKLTVLAVANGSFLLELEQRAISAYNTHTPNGYNMTVGGDVNPMEGKTHSIEVRNAISAAGVGRVLSPEARAKISASKIGKKRSPETCAKMSNSMMGKKLSEETKKKIVAARVGYKHSEETRAKISTALTGKKYGSRGKGRMCAAETRAKISSTLKGRKLSPEHIENRTVAQTGSKRSATTKEKISIANKRTWFLKHGAGQCQ